MPGIKGMKMPANTKSLRQTMWKTIRILRRFTVPDLLKTIPELKYSNAEKFVRALVKHGYLAKIGNYVRGKRGTDYQQYALINNSGPIVPVLNIGRSQKFLKNTGKEKEKETNELTETEKEAGHDPA